MRPLPVLCLLLTLCAAAVAVGRLASDRAYAAAGPGSDRAPARAPDAGVVTSAPPGEDLRVLLGSPVVGATAPGRPAADAHAGRPLGRLADLLVDAASGHTRGCLVAVDGPSGPIARRVDLRAEAWRPAARQVQLGLGPRAFASLPEFDPRSLEPGTVLASELLVPEAAAERAPTATAELRVDLAEQRLTWVERDARTLPWVPLR